MPTIPAPGVHRQASEQTYDNWPLPRSSLLRKFDRSAAHARQHMLHPPPPTPALELGRAIHLAILEPDRFEKEVIRGLTKPDSDAPLERRSNRDKAAWAEFENRHADKQILRAEDYRLCQSMRRAAWKHPLARAILGAEGARELACVYDDPDTGVRCKIRPDLVLVHEGHRTVVDVKSALDASPRGFGRQAANLGYYQQAWMYSHGLDVLRPAATGFLWLAIEKEPPFEVAIYEATVDVLELGKRAYDRQIAAWKRCNETGEWPGYNDTKSDLWVPRWRLRELEELDDG